MTRDEMVLLSLDDMIRNAHELGISACSFIELKNEFKRIMKERDELKAIVFDSAVKRFERRKYYDEL